MKKQVTTFVLVLLGTMLRAYAQDTFQPPIVGGPCTYQDIKGTAKITAITPAPEGLNNCPNAQEVKVRFVETATKKVSETFIQIYDGKNPSKAWVKRNKLVVGKSIKGVKRQLQTGTCTPTVYVFPTLVTLPDRYCQ